MNKTRPPHLPQDFSERLAELTTGRKYREFDHQQLKSLKPKQIERQLPDNMPVYVKRRVAKSIARLERLAMKGGNPPGFQLSYPDTEGTVSTFCYVPGNAAEQIAHDFMASKKRCVLPDCEVQA